MQKWQLAKLPLTTQDVQKVEETFGFKFRDDYKEQMLEANGAFPSEECFVTKSGKQRVLNNLFSLREQDALIYICANQPTNSKHSLFAIGGYGMGNLIGYCEGKIVFWVHEDDSVEEICDSFTQFLRLLS